MCMTERVLHVLLETLFCGYNTPVDNIMTFMGHLRLMWHSWDGDLWRLNGPCSVADFTLIAYFPMLQYR